MKVLFAAIYPYAFLLLYLTIPFDNYIRALPNILLLILLITFPFVIKKEHLQKIQRLPIFIYLLLVAYIVVSAFFRNTLEDDLTVVKKILLPLGLVFLYLPIAGFKKINKAIIYSSLLAIVFSVVNIMVISDTYDDFLLGDSPKIIEGLLIDRLYLGLLGVLSILVSAQSIKKKFHPNNRYYLANILLNGVFLFFIVSKVAVLTLVVLSLLRLLYSWNKKAALSVTLALLILPPVLFFSISNEFKQKNILNSTYGTKAHFIQHSLTWDVRTVAWTCAEKIGINLEDITTGLGFENSKENLIECYAESIQNDTKRNDFVIKRYNSHNQFADFYLSTGIFGIALFLLFIILLISRANTHSFTAALSLVLLIYLSVENIFNRQIGAYYLGFILIYLLQKNFGTLENDFFERRSTAETQIETEEK